MKTGPFWKDKMAISRHAGVQELAAYYMLISDTRTWGMEDASRTLRSRLPSYMIPAYLEELPEIPMLCSD